MKKSILKKNDILLIGGFLVIFAVIMLILSTTNTSGNQVVVSIDGVESYSFPLNEDLEFVITGYEGGTNYLVIENGEAYLKDASCPDHLCVHMGKISNVGQSIICLPNRVVIEIEGNNDKNDGTDEYDVIVGG